MAFTFNGTARFIGKMSTGETTVTLPSLTPAPEGGNSLFPPVNQPATGVTQQFVLTPNDPVSESFFGRVIGMGPNYTAVSQLAIPNFDPEPNGHVDIFDNTTGNIARVFTSQGSPDEDFGVDLQVVGDLVMIGEMGSGAKIYNMATGALVHTLTPLTPTGFDTALKVAYDGEYAIMRGDGGTVDVYNLSGSSYTITGPNFFFGSDIAVGNGVIAITEPGDGEGESTTDSVKLYTASTGALISTITEPGTNDWGDFGYGLEIRGNILAIGSGAGANFYSGTVYIYDISNPASPQLYRTLANPTPADAELFGNSMAIAGNKIMIGGNNLSFGYDTLTPNNAVLYNMETDTVEQTFTTVGSIATVGMNDEGLLAVGEVLGNSTLGHVFVYN